MNPQPYLHDPLGPPGRGTYRPERPRRRNRRLRILVALIGVSLSAGMAECTHYSAKHGPCVDYGGGGYFDSPNCYDMPSSD